MTGYQSKRAAAQDKLAQPSQEPLREALKLALMVMEELQAGCTDHDYVMVQAIPVWCPDVIYTIKAALAQEPVACKGE